MVVSKDTVISSTWETIYDLINSVIVDPKSRGVKWLFGSYPNPESKDFCGWPVVIIESPDINVNHFSIGKQLRQWPIAMKIAVFTDWSEHADTISDEIITILRNNELVLEQGGLYKFKVTSTPIGYDDVNGNRIYGKSIRIAFEFVEKETYGS